MNKLGSGENGELTFLDIVSLLSFFVGIENLDMNLTQDDKQELQNDLSTTTNRLLDEIHSHLAEQDRKLDIILERLNDEH